MLTQSEQSQTTTSTTVTINLTKGQPYSWYIVSKSNTTTETAQSAKWKFYLKAEPVANYSPFPADLVSPKSEATVNAGSIKFEWSGSDADTGDTLTFDVYVDSSNPPTTKIKTNHTSSSINHPINDSGTYYWKIITKDNVLKIMKEMAIIVDKQNKNDKRYINMSDDYERSRAFKTACELVFKGKEQPSGYTEPLLHLNRLKRKINQN